MESPGFESDREQQDSASNLEQQQQEASGAREEEKPKRRRNRKPVTCAQCRKRKLKCDRGSPCGACKDRNEGHLCEWEGAIRLPQSNYTRDQEAAELRSQLDRLEGLLRMLSGDVDGGGRTPDVDTERTSAAEALGLLAGTSNASSSGSGNAPSQPSILPFAAGSTPQTLDQILSILPLRVELDMLLQQFLSQTILLFPIVHVPSFRERYRTYDSTTARSEPFFTALLFAVAGWETHWRTTDPRARGMAAVKEGTIRMYLSSAMEILHVSGFTETPSLDALRTLLVLHLYYIQQDSSLAKQILNMAVQVAHDLGLNRDPSSFKCFTPLEAEERRRLWTILLSLDWLDNSGRTYLCSPVQCDTLLPANARDEDVSDTGVLNRPLTYSTPMLHTLFIFQIAAAAHSITDRAYGLQRVLTYSTIIELSGELSRIDSSLPPSLAFEWTNGAVKPYPNELSALDQTRVSVHLQLRQQFIRLHRPFLTRGFVDARFAFSRDKVCWAARYILAIHRGLGDDSRATRSWKLLFHALNALCILAIDLLLDPRGSYADIHRQDVASSIKLLEARPTKSSTVKEVLRVVAVLLRRSAGTELLKKRKHDEIVPQRTAGYSSNGGGEAGPSELLSFLPNQKIPSVLRNPSDPSPVAGPPPFDVNIPFRRPLPIPMSVDPITLFHAKGASTDPEFSGLWNGLSRVKGMYGVPDFWEWGEVVEGGAWSAGIDLLC